MPEFHPENEALEWGANRLVFNRRPEQERDEWWTANFRRAEVPDGINMSCFEQVDSTGKVLGRVWVAQSVEVETEPIAE